MMISDEAVRNSSVLCFDDWQSAGVCACSEMWVFSMPACDFSFIECVCTALGAAIARAKRRLVYGGGSTGLMGEVSAAALKQDGDVIGITPAAMMSVHGSAPSVHGVGRLEEVSTATNENV